jgi:hypothetical protein
MVSYNEVCSTFEYSVGGWTLICFSMRELQKQVKDIYGVDIKAQLN